LSLPKVLIISGPTATGKTNLAIQIAKKFKGELISADSRQIYRGMDIGTGKDHPSDIKIHLIDIIHPNQAFSSADYRKSALATINEIHSRGHLPIIVGGTGLYIDAITNPRESFGVKPNNFLRFFLNKLSVVNLQKLYTFLDQKSYSLLNHSDLHNPHRLIRKIEISLTTKTKFMPRPVKGGERGGFQFLHLSLTAPNGFLFDRIDQRIDQRLKDGLLDEIKTLTQKYSWSHPGLNTLAYKEFKPYFDNISLACLAKAQCRRVKGRSGEAERDFVLKSCISRWRFDEHAYARRQKTWFKKIPDIHFVDITKADHLSLVDKLIRNFLSS